MTDLKLMGENAVAAKYQLAALTRDEKDRALIAAAKALRKNAVKFLAQMKLIWKKDEKMACIPECWIDWH